MSPRKNGHFGSLGTVRSLIAMPDVTDFGVTGDGKVQGRAAGDLALPPYRVRSAKFQRPLTLPLSPSDGERVAFRPGEGNTCVTSAWWWCRVAPARRSPSRRGRRRKFAFAPGRRSEVRTAVT